LQPGETIDLSAPDTAPGELAHYTPVERYYITANYNHSHNLPPPHIPEDFFDDTDRTLNEIFRPQPAANRPPPPLLKNPDEYFQIRPGQYFKNTQKFSVKALSEITTEPKTLQEEIQRPNPYIPEQNPQQRLVVDGRNYHLATPRVFTRTEAREFEA
jgi:hypothetical protein